MPHYADVAIPAIKESFLYELPDCTTSLGERVHVPLGRRQSEGYIVAVRQELTQLEKGIRIRPIIDRVEGWPLFSATDLKFYSKVADYYCEGLGNVIATALPASVPKRKDAKISLINKDGLTLLRGKREREIFLQIAKESATETRGITLSTIKHSHPGVSNKIIKKMVELNIITLQEFELFSSYSHQQTAPVWAQRAITLNPTQSECLSHITEDIQHQRFTPFLLHGVTGSGKTEVYLEAIKKALLLSRTALVIVPEIALTPQLIDRFRGRLGHDIAVLHSALSARERISNWRAILDGRMRVAVGVRSAIFAPLPNIGLIVVDEEHDSSYKQSDSFRYNARDMALLRGQLNSCPVILGSATPALESYYRATTNKYRYLELPERPGTALPPKVTMIDLNATRPWEMETRNISKSLHNACKKIIARDEQIFLLYNRRGFAKHLQCEQCGEAIGCKNCSITLTYHRDKNQLLCHGCGANELPPQRCPACVRAYDGGNDQEPGILIERGSGSEQVFEEIQKLFPAVKIARLDSDSTDNHNDYKKILTAVRDGEIKIVVGTQMIAKGHDLPNVTLVGIVDCDVGIHMPDFRAGERTFQLLTQAAGRAGRGTKAGEVIMQTRLPKHPSIICSINSNYKAFAAGELATRRAHSFPPYSRLLRVVITDQAQDDLPILASKFAKLADEIIASKKLSITRMGPVPAPITKLKAKYRWHMVFKGLQIAELRLLLTLLKQAKIKSSKAKLVFDLDPADMM